MSRPRKKKMRIRECKSRCFAGYETLFRDENVENSGCGGEWYTDLGKMSGIQKEMRLKWR
ncbi:unnamed protein product [Orchesella dallaii]|uniref:Uncharacterized protein n=1 Tax=Orchesella dallaii TaxID=48710 RepID=A0ABP1Q2J4_9HEXA